MRDIRWWHGGGVPTVVAVKTIAVLGTGHMGTPIARRLLASGYRVIAWNRTAERAAPLVAEGATLAASPAEAARDADAAITMLTDGSAVEEVLFAGGAAAALRPGACLVEMSTIGPDAVRALATRLPAGVDLVDAPVGGSVGAAASGQLRVLAGGDPAALDRVEPVLSALGAVRRCGGLGAGAAMKLVANTALVTAVAALADTLAVADALGVDRDAALEVVGTGALSGVAGRLGGGSAFSVALAAKDLDLALRALGTAPAPVARGAAATLSTMENRSAELSSVVENAIVQ
jgi:3-hydroxyisobutyrate dehydrogenase-like beta-hydroxyacid dehydrogenase